VSYNQVEKRINDMEGLISTVLNKQDKVNKSVTNDNIFNQSGQSVLPNSKNAK
jgi:hypothetical protein